MRHCIHHSALAAFVTLTCSGLAQDPAQRNPNQPLAGNQPATKSQRFLTLDDLRGKAIYASDTGTGGLGNPGNREAGAVGNQGNLGKKIGTIEDIAIGKPSATTDASGGRGGIGGTDRTGGIGDPKPMGGGFRSDATHARAIVRLSEGSTTKEPDDMNDRPGGVGVDPGDKPGSSGKKCVAIPLSELEWQADRMSFTVSKTAASIQSMPSYEYGPDKGMTHKDKDYDKPDRDKDPMGGTNRPGDQRNPGVGTSTTLPSHDLLGKELAKARLTTQDNKQGNVSGLVFDVQRGDLCFLLVSANAFQQGGMGTGGVGGVDDTGKRDTTGGATSMGGEFCVIPWSLASVDQTGTGAGTGLGTGNDKQPGTDKTPANQPADGAGRPDTGRLTIGMNDLTLKLRATADQIAKAPKIDKSQLSKLDAADLRQQLETAFPGVQLNDLGRDGEVGRK